MKSSRERAVRMKHRRTVLTALLMAAAGLILVIPAHAQTGDMGGRLEQELQRTDEIIQRATELVRDAGNAQAAELVKKAVAIQSEAHMSFRNGRRAMSATQTKTARELAQRAMGLVMRPEERKERVQVELERTDEMLQGAKEKMTPDWPETAMALLSGAGRQQENAWEYYRADQLRPALRLTLQVREILRKLQRQMAGNEPGEIRAHVDQIVDLVRRAVREAEESGQRHRIKLADRAREMLRRAQESMQDGRGRAARPHLEQAERLARQSLRVENRNDGADEFETSMMRYQQELKALQERLSEFPSAEATRLVDESMEHHRLAREVADGEEQAPERAMAELRIAMRLLGRAADLLR